MARFYTQDGEAVDIPEEKPMTIWELTAWKIRRAKTDEAIKKALKEQEEHEKAWEIQLLEIYCGMSNALLTEKLTICEQKGERCQGEEKTTRRALELQAKYGRRTEENKYPVSFSD